MVLRTRAQQPQPPGLASVPNSLNLQAWLQYLTNRRNYIGNAMWIHTGVDDVQIVVEHNKIYIPVS